MNREGARAIANAISPLGVVGTADATGAHVESLTEAVMGITAALVQIAQALQEIAEAVREGEPRYPDPPGDP